MNFKQKNKGQATTLVTLQQAAMLKQVRPEKMDFKPKKWDTP